ILAGNRHTPTPKPTSADAVYPSTRTDDEMRTAVLEALGGGPLMKEQIREQLHEAATRLVRILNQLKAERRVKVIGRSPMRKWALLEWKTPSPPLAPLRSEHTAVTPRDALRGDTVAKYFFV